MEIYGMTYFSLDSRVRKIYFKSIFFLLEPRLDGNLILNLYPNSKLLLSLGGTRISVHHRFAVDVPRV